MGAALPHVVAPTDLRPSRNSNGEVARQLYYCPDAAELLLVAALDTEPSERRLRARKALECLDLYEDVLAIETPDPLAGMAASIGRVFLATVRGATPEARGKAAALLAEITRLASEVAE